MPALRFLANVLYFYEIRLTLRINQIKKCSETLFLKLGTDFRPQTISISLLTHLSI